MGNTVVVSFAEAYERKLIHIGDIIKDSEGRVITVTGLPEKIDSGFISVKGFQHGVKGERYFDSFPTSDVKISYAENEEEVYV